MYRTLSCGCSSSLPCWKSQAFTSEVRSRAEGNERLGRYKQKRPISPTFRTTQVNGDDTDTSSYTQSVSCLEHSFDPVVLQSMKAGWNATVSLQRLQLLYLLMPLRSPPSPCCLPTGEYTVRVSVELKEYSMCATGRQIMTTLRNYFLRL